MPSINIASIDDPRLQPPQKHAWQDDALCSQVGVNMFFPPKGGDTAPAKRLCDQCSVPLTCLVYALKAEVPDKEKDNTRYGIFGGLAPMERKALVNLFKDYPSLSLEEAVDEIKARRKRKGNPKFRKAA